MLVSSPIWCSFCDSGVKVCRNLYLYLRFRRLALYKSTGLLPPPEDAFRHAGLVHVIEGRHSPWETHHRRSAFQLLESHFPCGPLGHQGPFRCWLNRQVLGQREDLWAQLVGLWAHVYLEQAAHCHLPVHVSMMMPAAAFFFTSWFVLCLKQYIVLLQLGHLLLRRHLLQLAWQTEDEIPCSLARPFCMAGSTSSAGRIATVVAVPPLEARCSPLSRWRTPCFFFWYFWFLLFSLLLTAMTQLGTCLWLPRRWYSRYRDPPPGLLSRWPLLVHQLPGVCAAHRTFCCCELCSVCQGKV